MTFEATGDGLSILVRGMDRLRFPPWGVCGGKPAAPVQVILDRGRPTERDLGKMTAPVALERGRTLSVLTPGAAGYGDPCERAADAVTRDVELGFVSRDAAESDYGVVLGPGLAVDHAATDRLRARRVRPNAGSDFGFGPEREAWERVFDDAVMQRLNRGLYALPRAQRKAARLRIFKAAIPDLPRAGSGRLSRILIDPDAIRARLEAAMAEAFAGAHPWQADARTVRERATPDMVWQPVTGRGVWYARALTTSTPWTLGIESDVVVERVLPARVRSRGGPASQNLCGEPEVSACAKARATCRDCSRASP